MRMKERSDCMRIFIVVFVRKCREVEESIELFCY